MILYKYFRALIVLCFFVASFHSLLSAEFNSYIIKYSEKANIKNSLNQLTQQNIDHFQIFSIDLAKAIKKTESVLSSDSEHYADNISKFFIISKEDADNSIVIQQIESGIIESLEPNYIFSVEKDNISPPNDPRYKEQWALEVLGADKSWEKATGEGIVIGVVDTGIDYLHDDLINQLKVSPAEDLNNNGQLDAWSSEQFRGGVSGDFNGIDDDGNGFVDDVIGYDFVDQTVTNLGDHRNHDGHPFDEMGHGTQVSGLIAAEKNNGIGIVGLAFNSRILSIRAFDFTGNAEADDIANSIVYAALNGADIINMSFGESVNSMIVESAVKLAASLGCFMVASAGNSGSDRPHYPSDYDEVLSVGTIYENKDRDSQSNWGDRLDLMATGTGVLTTTFFNDYKTVGGTSFAAPYAAATAALLLELNSELNPNEISGILQQTSEDMPSGGWDPYIGAGLLNAGRSVNYTGRTVVDIAYPPNDYYHSEIDGDDLYVIGTIAVPFFKDYQLFIGEGISPENWTELTNLRDFQVIGDTLTKINLKLYKQESYTIRLLVNLNNNRTLEKRNRIYLPQNSAPLKIVSHNALNIWYNEKNRLVIGIRSNQPNLSEVRYRPKGTTGEDSWRYVSDNLYYEHFHTILIDEAIEPDVEMEAMAMVKTVDGQSAEKEFTFTLKSESMPISGFARKTYALPISYLLNQVEFLYGDGEPTIVVNDITGASWNATDIYQFSDNKFVKRDSSASIWIPSGMGDSNGDGINELLTSANRKTKLTQASQQGGSPFTRVLFSDTTSAKFWAAGFFDLDQDGFKDIIGYNDTAFFAVSYKNGIYSLLAIADMDGYSAIGSYPGSALGDFDNDGKIELIHSNQRSHLFVWEYSNGIFQLEMMDSSETSAYTPIYMTKCDIDGNGIPEILMANYGTKETMGQHEGGTPIWLCRVIEYVGDKFNTIWKTNAWGVKSGTTMTGLSFRNGVAAGDIDGEPGDEIIFSPFPNYYVFKWDNESSEMKPFWWHPNAYNNSALIYDFDGNGIKEMGFTTTQGTFFYEFQKDLSAPKTPTNFDGWALNESSAYFIWDQVDNADGYEIFRIITDEQGTELVSYGITSDTEITINELGNNQWYEFTIASFSNSTQNKYSEGSYSLRVFTHRPVQATDVIVSTNTSILFLNFDGKLPTGAIDPSVFSLVASELDIIPIEVVRSTDTSIVLTLNRKLLKGDYSVLVRSFRDFYRTPTIESGLDFTITDIPEPEKDLYLFKLEVMSKSELILYYSEPVEKIGAENISNYNLLPYGSIESIYFDSATPDKVIINPDQSFGFGPRGQNYTITVSNVMAQSGREMTLGAGNTLSFVLTAEDGSNAYVYPNPIKISENPDIYFANLPPKAEVIIYTLEGEELRTLEEIDSNGGVEWDGLDKNGENLPSGIYLFKVKSINRDGTTTTSEIKKFAIIR